MKAKFHIPDFTRNFALNMALTKLIKERPDLFREGVEIASVYGEFPPSLWNGGRTVGGRTDRPFMKEVLKRFNALGIPCRYTFTNPDITEKDLNDAHCNAALKLADNGLNEVIVFSPLLEEYIRSNYPNFKITSSTCKQIETMEGVLAELDKDYNLVVLDYNWNNRFDELEKIPDKARCELLVNACCTPKCTRRGEHYRVLAANQREFVRCVKFGEKYKSIPFECPHMNKTIFEIKDYSTHITPDDIWEKYIPMGFENFKIEGRSSHMFNLIETYMYYMAKPECKDEARFILLMTLASSKNIVIN